MGVGACFGSDASAALGGAAFATTTAPVVVAPRATAAAMSATVELSNTSSTLTQPSP